VSEVAYFQVLLPFFNLYYHHVWKEFQYLVEKAFINSMKTSAES